MPTYDFRCRDCRQVFEEKVSVETDLLPCPRQECQGVADRLPSAPGFSVKGFNAKNGYAKDTTSRGTSDEEG